MKYEIQISETCLEEIEDICEYIENNLKAKKASINLRKKIIEAIMRLNEFPQIHTKIERRDRLNREYRKIIINNYVLLYTIIEEDKVILVSHMYYSGRNYLEGLF